MSKRAQRTVVAFVAVLCLVGVWSPSTAGAQEDCYPDGCTEPTNPPPVAEVTCELTTETGQSGDEVTAIVRDVPPAGGVRILFDGTEVANSTEGGAEVRVPFTVPDVEPGTYSVVATGPTFSADCASFRVGDADVLGEGETAGAVDSEPTGGRSTGALPFTGSQLGLLVAIAVAMLLVGWRLVSAAKRRRVAHA